MKGRNRVRLAACAALVSIAAWGNPIFEGWYADPQIRRYGDSYWVFPTTSDRFARQVSFDAFSSKDMKTWTKLPRILTTNEVAWAKGAMWAPDVGEFEGEVTVKVRPHAAKFYLFDAARRLDREVYEAETAYLTDYSELDGTPYGSTESCRKQGRAYYDAVEKASGGMAVVNLGGRETNDLIWRDVNVASSGQRHLVFRCASQEERTFFVQIDGGEKMPLTIPATAGGFAEASLSVKLEASNHSIRLLNGAAPMPDIDFMRIQL